MIRTIIRMFCILGLVSVAILFVLSTGCEDSKSPCPPGGHPVSYPERNNIKVTIEQGIWGDVWFWEGNFQPICPSGNVTAVSREIRIHELTHMDNVVFAPDTFSTFYIEIHTELVATIWSDDDGFFEVELPSGQYSVFAVEDTFFYANRFDGVGNIYPVEVSDNKVIGILFNINYQALW